MRPTSWASPAHSSFIGANRIDLLALKAKLDAQRAAIEALAEDAEDLRRRYGV